MRLIPMKAPSGSWGQTVPRTRDRVRGEERQGRQNRDMDHIHNESAVSWRPQNQNTFLVN